MDAQRAVARRMIVGLPREGLSRAWEENFAACPAGGVILFARDFGDLAGLRRLTARLRELARPHRLFLAMDEEGGFVSQLGCHLIVPPNALLLGRGGSLEDIEWASRVTGGRLRALGIDWCLAPVADVHSEPRNPVIGPRAFGVEPEAVRQRVAAALRGFRAAGLAACLKHFPGHGDTVLDSHLALPHCPADEATLAARELLPFRANLGAGAVMTAHVVYPALDRDLPATFSRAVVQGLLRGRLGFGGVCVTDALEMAGAAAGRTRLEAARLAIAAGCDLVLFATHDEELRRVRRELADALAGGALGDAGFEAAGSRLGAFDRAHPEPTAAQAARPLDALTPPAWEERLERIAERGLIVRGDIRSPLPVRVSEPDFVCGPPLREDLAALGVRLAADQDEALELIAVASRRPLPGEEIERLRALARRRPLALVGLQNDAFLEELPEAALRLSAADATPLTRRVVARTVAACWHAASATRA